MVYTKLRDRQHQGRTYEYKVENTENILDKEHRKWGKFMS